ncbi:MAG: hypothetical protein FD173_1238 [Gallionellaceae bacterium]|nr:MAG: hypothetical protein FD173_1238 [Gallionellaceae bacterium]
MKQALIAIFTLFVSTAHAEGALRASLADAAWDGNKIPAGQQCARFGGKGATPVIKVEQIPVGANALVIEFSDLTYQPMNNGGHGKIAYRIASGSKQTTIPSVAGHSFDLPSGFFLIEAQRAPSWDKAGAYLPPCSGGKGNTYVVTVKAVKEVDGKISTSLAETTVKIGLY